MTQRFALLLASLALPLLAAPPLAPHAAAQAAGGAAVPRNADDASQGAAGFLRQARSALQAGRLAQARENLEQAETRLLTRSVLPSQAGSPADGGAIGAIADAREALRGRDRAAVEQHIDLAMARLQAAAMAPGGKAPMTGSDALPKSADGGGAPAAVPVPVPVPSEPVPAPMFAPGVMPAPTR
ncbi:hypothetical protein [Falsiroseomonas selenitidurans]|uniref:DUF4398 domain-containing protein n=1 Tax=Falsiroseomonas selenitidurans TaxID=2716335 RepID=A0ABX1EFM1_9PROT|nr:hypothetical protein [Falsiroseomonas selenitidurans]NKC34523.1 hypothetical protein [Falsiroseomonas selenitidurans]